MTADRTNDSPLADNSVLLVEDEFLIALDAEAILVELGAARVEVVGTLEAARKMLDRVRVDLAVFDVNINGEMSFALAEDYSARGIPVIFASGYQLAQAPTLNGRAAECLNKPYTKDGVRTAVTNCLRAAQLRPAGVQPNTDAGGGGGTDRGR